jgi:peptidoglycan-N-acetylmuramic acid deacetylase
VIAMKKIIFSVFFILVLLIVPAVNAKSYGWGFKRNGDSKTPDIGMYKKEIEGTNSYYVGDEKSKVVYLTFDAGYDNGNMEKILLTLREKKVKSTFFITGDFLTRESELVKLIVKDGHIVGNHTWGHKNITTLSQEKLQSELQKVEEKYKDLTGLEMKKFFRPPAGNFNKQSLKMVADLGYSTFFWSIAFKDWINNDRGDRFSYDSVIGNLHNGALILMHTVSNDNALALPMIIDEIRAQGYTIRNLDYLLSSGN